MTNLPTLPRFQPRNPDFEVVVRKSFMHQGLLKTLGAELISVEPGSAKIALRRSDATSQQQGFIHGGAITSVADSAGGYAALSLMPVASEVVTVEFKINFLRPATTHRIVAIGQVLRPGKSLTVCQVDVLPADDTHGEGEAPIALMQATFARVDLSSA